MALSLFQAAVSISTRVMCADRAPHHPALDPFHRKERFGRDDLWVNGLPAGESPTGQEHAGKARALRRRLWARRARPAR